MVPPTRHEDYLALLLNELDTASFVFKRPDVEDKVTVSVLEAL